MEAISPTVLVSMPRAVTKPNMTKMAVREAGTTLVSLGKPKMIAIPIIAPALFRTKELIFSNIYVI